jgi:hypothetical protein
MRKHQSGVHAGNNRKRGHTKINYRKNSSSELQILSSAGQLFTVEPAGCNVYRQI